MCFFRLTVCFSVVYFMYAQRDQLSGHGSTHRSLEQRAHLGQSHGTLLASTSPSPLLKRSIYWCCITYFSGNYYILASMLFSHHCAVSVVSILSLTHDVGPILLSFSPYSCCNLQLDVEYRTAFFSFEFSRMFTEYHGCEIQVESQSKSNTE